VYHDAVNSNGHGARCIRQVPDNQEVYIARGGLTTIVFELTERAAPPAHPCVTDEQALRYHYDDMVADVAAERNATLESTRTWLVSKASFANL